MTSSVNQAEPPLPRPDYAGGGIVNLVSSLMAGFGAHSHHPQCPDLPGTEIVHYRNVVLLLIDGLGYDFLQRRRGNIIGAGLRTRLTSVFPSTTASAITSYATGLTPGEHGLTGWFTYLRELGSVATVLPFRPRHGGPGYSAMGIDPLAIFAWPAAMDAMDGCCAVVTPHYIADSEYSRATAGRARRIPYRDMTGYFRAIGEALQLPGARRYVYAYWPELDSLCHRHGTDSAVVDEHFTSLCVHLERFLRTVSAETLILVCADHGHIDTSADKTVHLQDHPELAACLTLPLCGEPRAAYCYVHPDAATRFEQYVQTQLASQCQLLARADVLGSGLLGPGRAHPELGQRIGDYLLLMRENWIIRDRLPGEPPLVQVGVHGGLSAAEMFVPLASFAA